LYGAAVAEKPKSDPNTELHRTLNNACRKCAGNPSALLAEAVAEPLGSRSPDRSSRVIDKIRADIPTAELTLQDMDSFNAQPIARGVGDTATDAIKTMWPL